MILGRLTDAVRTQNWFAVVLEFLIVSAGVFLGIQFGNWNSLRAEAAREQVFIERLEADFLLARDDVEKSLARSERFAADMEALFALLLDEDTALSAEMVAPYINALGSASAPSRPSPTFVEMQSSGALSTLDSEALRKALVEYQLVVGLSQEGLKFALAGFDPDRIIFKVTRIPEGEGFGASDILYPELLREAIGEVNYMKAAHTLQAAYAKRSLEVVDEVLAELENSKR